jgi:hypothetical protein
VSTVVRCHWHGLDKRSMSAAPYERSSY